MDEKEKKETLEIFDKFLDLRCQSDDLIEEINDLIEQCDIELKKI